MSNESLQKLVGELDVLIRARYPLIAANTHEENRFRRVIHAVAGLKCHKEKDKGLYLWSRTTGLRQTIGKEVKGREEILIPDTQDPISVLEYIAKQPKGLFVLCDYSPYLAPYGQEDPQLVRRLRELAWDIKSRHTTVLFVERNFPDIPALEKEVKARRAATLPKSLPNYSVNPRATKKQKSSTCKPKPRGRSQIRNERSARMRALTQILVDARQSQYTSSEKVSQT